MFASLDLISLAQAHFFSIDSPLLRNPSFGRIMGVLKKGVKDMKGLFRRKVLHSFRDRSGWIKIIMDLDS